MPALYAHDPKFDPKSQHILWLRFGPDTSMAVVPDLLIQEEQLSVTCHRMCTRYLMCTRVLAQEQCVMVSPVTDHFNMISLFTHNFEC